jgi:hypothetical protein
MSHVIRTCIRGEVNNMRKELTFEELDSQQAELLPARETLSYHGGGGSSWAGVIASNTSNALNVASYCSTANSAAVQTITNVAGH